MMSQKKKNIESLVKICGAVRPGDRVLIVADESLREIGNELLGEAAKLSGGSRLEIIPVAGMHGTEPPEKTAKLMSDSDVVFGLTKFSMAHTTARHNLTSKGGRYLSLADYDDNQISRPSISVDYHKWAAVGKTIEKILNGAETIRITTKLGTDLEIKCGGRRANWCPGYCDEPGMLGSPPDIETNISPIEEESNGTLVVDGSIPCKEVGLLKEPVTLTIEKGRITSFAGPKETVWKLTELFGRYPDNAKVLAEFGIGLNPEAELCGLMLEDEGCLGTVHFGFGSNITVGGKNAVNFHLDFVVKDPTAYSDGKKFIDGGKLTDEILREHD